MIPLADFTELLKGFFPSRSLELTFFCSIAIAIAAFLLVLMRRRSGAWTIALNVLIVLCAVTAAGGAYWSARQQGEFEKEMREAAEETSRFQQKMRIQSEQRAIVERRLRESAEKTLASVTGGDSFCHLMPWRASSKSDSCMISVSHTGEFPLYNVSATLADLEKFAEIKDSLSPDNLGYCYTFIEIGDIVPHSVRTLPYRISLGTGTSKSYNIFFMARNGYFTQLLRLKRVGGKWLTATRVKRDNTVLFEQIQPGFPLNSAGKVDW